MKIEGNQQGKNQLINQQEDQQENVSLAQNQSSVLMAEITENLLWEQQGMIIPLPRWAAD